MKKMPRSVYLSLFLLIVGVIAGGLLAGVNYFTAPIIEDNKLKELQKTFDEINVTILNKEEVDLVSGVTAVYTGTFEGKESFVITTENSNKYTTVKVIVVMEKATGSVIQAKVTGDPNITTHGFDSNFTNDKLGLIGATSGDDLNKISGATVSTDSVRVCLNAAIEQFTQIAGSIVKQPTVKVVDTKQIYTEGTYDRFEATLTVDSEELSNATVKIIFTLDATTNSLTYVSSDTDLSHEMLVLCMGKIKTPTDYIKSYDAETNTFVVNTYFSFESGTTFTTTIKLASDGTIETYEVTTSNGFTDNWQDKTAESNAFIASVPGTNISGIDSLEYVSGATHTSNAFKNALLLVKEYVGGAE